MRTARIVLGAIAGVLLVALLATVFLSRGTVDEAEAEAEARAVDWANSVLFDAVTPEEVALPILGPDYRELLIIVQAGILSDDRATRMRLWNADGTLVFSTDQRDKIEEFIAADNPQIEAALQGQTVSVPTETTVAPKSGLAGTEEKLLQTFVPLRLENQFGISGVAQIDQSYAAIEAEASDTWQTARLVLVLALTAAVGGFLLTLRRRPAEEGEMLAGEAAVVPTRRDRKALERAAKAEDELRAAVERAQAAEAALAEADGTMNEAAIRLRDLEERAARSDERAANAEAALRDAALAATGGEPPRRGVPGVGAVAMGVASVEMSARLEAAEAERDQLTGEVGRLRAALTEREAELALAREGVPGAGEDAGVEDLRRLADEHERRATELDGRLAAAMRELGESQERAASLEERLREAEATVVAASAAAATPEPEAAHARTTKELEAARAELAKADSELAAAREALAARDEEAASAKAAEAGAVALGARLAEAEAAMADLETAMKDVETRASQAEDRAASAEARAAELEAGATQAAARISELEAVATQAETRLTEAEAALASAVEELEQRRAEPTAPDAGGDVDELRARIAELEEARRSDVAELQRAQETLVNTQFEATQSRRRVKELEEQLQHAEIAAPPPVPEYVPEPVPESSFSARLAHLVREHEPPPDTGPVGTEPEAPVEEEGLSLRERLARAAAARHRMSGPPGSDG